METKTIKEDIIEKHIPTHEEIMTKWWKFDDESTKYFKVIEYDSFLKECYVIIRFPNYSMTRSKKDFENYISCDIPPEKE